MATRRAKKRKCDEAELDGGVPPPVREKPEAGEGTDQISDLPVDVLRSIVSLLPTKDGARTQSLSTRWRHLFRSAPLNLSVDLRREDEPAPSSLVSRILAHHQAPCRRLSLTWYGYKSDFLSPLLNRCLQPPALNGLPELDLWHKRKLRRELPREREEDPYDLPPSALRFSPTLRVLSIKCTGCMIHFPSTGAQAGDLHFPNLKQLTLKGVVVSHRVLHDVLAGCSALERLVLSELYGVSAVRINSSTLRRLGVSSGSGHEPDELLQQVIVEDAPLLEKLFLSGLDDHISVRVLCAPKLDFLGSLPEGFSKAKLETTFFQRTAVASLMSVVRTVKVLVLRMSPPSVDDAIDFLRFFPCLEKLYVLVVSSVQNSMNYHGTPRDIDFARFFLTNAKVLEHMEFASRIATNRKKYISEWIAAQPGKLQLDNRASQGAQFNFIPDSYSADGIHIGHIHDLTVSDPFDKSLCRYHGFDFL